MARKANEDETPDTPGAASIAGDPATQEAALAEHEAGAAERQAVLAEAQTKHDEETAALRQQIADLQASLDQQKRDAQAEADEAGAKIPARHDVAADLLRAPPAVEEATRDLVPEPGPPRPARFALGTNGELIAIADGPVESVVINQTRPGGEFIVGGVRVNAMGAPLRGGKAPAPEVPADLTPMPKPD